jgi:hypothetical protein
MGGALNNLQLNLFLKTACEPAYDLNEKLNTATASPSKRDSEFNSKK